MNKKNFLIVVLLFFLKILFIQSAQKEVKIIEIYYDSKNEKKWLKPENEKKLIIKEDKKIKATEVIDLLKNTNYLHNENLPNNFDTDYKLYLINFYKLNGENKVLDEFEVLIEGNA